MAENEKSATEEKPQPVEKPEAAAGEQASTPIENPKTLKVSDTKPGKKKQPKLSKREEKALKRADEKRKKKPNVKAVEGYDPWKVLIHPHLAEKSMNMVEMQNKLVFMVHSHATKAKVKEALEKGFGVAVEEVNINITKRGKKAFVKIHPADSAADIATRLGMI